MSDKTYTFVTVLDPFQLFTVSSTMFLEDDFMTAPFKVSDLFLYKNSRRSSSEIVLDIEIICDKNILLKAVLNMTDYIFNYPGGCCLDECKRYLVKATHVTRNKDKFTRTDKRMERYKHILIVTGISFFFMNDIINKFYFEISRFRELYCLSCCKEVGLIRPFFGPKI